MSQADGVLKFIRGAANASATDAPDAELVRRFATAGDEFAFRALVARYGPMVWAVCRRLVRDHHDAEDAFQAALLVFARKAGDLRTGEAVGGWLHAVAYRVASRVRSARRAEPSEAEPSDGPPGGALDELTVREAEAALHEELARLPEKYHAPLVLCCLDGLSRDEAATRLGWSANQVKHGLEQGRELLRSRLAGRGIVFGLSLLTGLLSSPASAAPLPLIELAVSYAAGTTVPPATIHSLAQGVNRTMWVAKWKWAAAGFAVLALAAGGALAAILRPAPQEAAPPVVPVANAPPILTRAEPAPAPKPRPPKPPWEVATEYLQFVIDGKMDRAAELGNRPGEETIKKALQTGLKRVRFVMILVNDSGAMVVAEPTELTIGNRKELCFVAIALGRKDADSSWRVGRVSIWNEREKVLAKTNDYLEGKFDFKPDEQKEVPGPKADWDVASEFLKLALAGKVDEALKLTVPGTISENKVSEVKRAGVTGTKAVAVLVNDRRMEVVFEAQELTVKADEKAAAHLVLMLTKSKDGTWQVKDIDIRNEEQIEPRIKLYFEGRYNDPPPKP